MNTNYNTSPVPQYNNTVPTRKSKKLYEMNKKDIGLFLGVIVTVFFCLRLGVFGGFNLGFSATLAVFTVLIFCFVIKKTGFSKIYNSFLFILSLALCVSFSFNDDVLIKFFDCIMILLLNILSYFELSANGITEKGTYKELLNAGIISLIGSAENLLTPYISIKNESKSGKYKCFVQVFIGCVIALPFLCVILPLLVSSDIAFEKLLETIFSNVAVLLVCLVITVFITPLTYSYIMALRKNALQNKNIDFSHIEKKTPATIINTVLSFISVCYIMYLVSQLAYITKAFSFLLPEDYSVAEFARDGFFEMLVITIINCLVVGTACVLTKRKNGKTNLNIPTKILCLFLLLFTLFYIVNAFIRMAQYIDVFGLTYLRVTTSVFMIMIFIITLVILLKLFVKKLPYARIILAVTAFTLIFLSFCPAKTIFSQYNASCYKNEKIKEFTSGDIELLNYSDIEFLLKSENIDKETKTLYLTGFVQKLESEFTDTVYFDENEKMHLEQSNHSGINYNSASYKNYKAQKRLFEKYKNFVEKNIYDFE